MPDETPRTAAESPPNPALPSPRTNRPRAFEPKICEACGAEWQPENRYQAHRNKSCSDACSRELIGRARLARHAKAVGDGSWHGWNSLDPESPWWVRARLKPNRRCVVCSRPFYRQPSHITAGVEPACSPACRGVRDRAVLAALIRNGRSNWTAASMRGFREKMSGANNPSWKGGVTFKRPHGNYPSVKYVRAPEWARPMSRSDGYILEHRLIMAMRCGFLLTRTEVVNHRNHDPGDNRPHNLELWPDNGSHRKGEAGRFDDGVACRWIPRDDKIPSIETYVLASRVQHPPDIRFREVECQRCGRVWIWRIRRGRYPSTCQACRWERKSGGGPGAPPVAT